MIETQIADSRLDEISRQLDTLTRLTAISLIQNRETLSDRIELLGRAGLSPKLIAELCGTTRNTVSVQLSRQALFSGAISARPAKRDSQLQERP